MSGWSAMWAPYDMDTYRLALSYIRPGATVLDIGAGDLRFSRLIVQTGCRVIAVENQAQVVYQGVEDGSLPQGLDVIIADARTFQFPTGIDQAVLLMRHCNFYDLLVRKLRACGCPVLITNARWGMGAEAVPLIGSNPFSTVQFGWYACVNCGHVGFIPGDPALWTFEGDDQVTNVGGCDRCQGHDGFHLHR